MGGVVILTGGAMPPPWPKPSACKPISSYKSLGRHPPVPGLVAIIDVSLDQNSNHAGDYVTRQEAGDHRAKTETRQIAPSFRRERSNAANLDRDA